MGTARVLNESWPDDQVGNRRIPEAVYPLYQRDTASTQRCTTRHTE